MLRPSCGVDALVDVKVHCGACSGLLIQRKNSKTGNVFFGCSNYPECTNTISERQYRMLHHEEGCSMVGEHPYDNEYDLGSDW